MNEEDLYTEGESLSINVTPDCGRQVPVAPAQFYGGTVTMPCNRPENHSGDHEVRWQTKHHYITVYVEEKS